MISAIVGSLLLLLLSITSWCEHGSLLTSAEPWRETFEASFQQGATDVWGDPQMDGLYMFISVYFMLIWKIHENPNLTYAELGVSHGSPKKQPPYQQHHCHHVLVSR